MGGRLLQLGLLLLLQVPAKTFYPNLRSTLEGGGTGVFAAT